MKSMNKITAFVLAVMVLAACGGGASSNDTASTTTVRQKNFSLGQIIDGISGSSVVTSTVPPTCRWGYSCSLGDVGPGGGIVIYDAGSNQTWGRYLEVAIANVGSTYWCYNSMTVALKTIGASGTDLGTGLANTEKMVKECKSGAGQMAAEYVSSTGMTDWYLPSSNEFDIVCKYLNGHNTVAYKAKTCAVSIIDGKVSSTTLKFWSSTESSVYDKAKFCYTYNGLCYDWYKSEPMSVRPIRAFVATR